MPPMFFNGGRDGFRARPVGGQEIIHGIGDALALADALDRAAAIGWRHEHFQIREERRPFLLVEMDGGLLEMAVELGGQVAHRLAVVPGVIAKRGVGVERFTDVDPHGAAKAFLALVVQAKRHEGDGRARLDCLQGQPGRAGADLLDARQVVALAFGKNPNGLAPREPRSAGFERGEILSHLRSVIRAAVGRHHAQGAHHGAEHRHIEQRRLCEEMHRAPRHKPDDGGVEHRVGMVRAKEHGARSGDALAPGYLNGRVVEPHEKPNGAAAELTDRSAKAHSPQEWAMPSGFGIRYFFAQQELARGRRPNFEHFEAGASHLPEGDLRIAGSSLPGSESRYHASRRDGRNRPMS